MFLLETSEINKKKTNPMKNPEGEQSFLTLIQSCLKLIIVKNKNSSIKKLQKICETACCVVVKYW